MSEAEHKETKTKQQLDRLIQNISGLIETRLKLFRLEMEQEAASAIALMITLSMVILFAAMVCLFLSLALAIALGIWFGNGVYGFLAVAGLYVLLLLAVNQMKVPLRNSIQKGIEKQWQQLLEKNANGEETLPSTRNVDKPEETTGL